MGFQVVVIESVAEHQKSASAINLLVGARTVVVEGTFVPLAHRLPRAAHPCSRGPAALRPTCHQAQRLARQSSRPALTWLQVARLRAWRVAGVTIWHERSARERSLRSAVREQRASSSNRRAKQRAVAYPRRPSASPRSPAKGRADFVSRAGAAGPSVVPRERRAVRTRDGSPSGARHGAQRRGSMRSTTARPRAAGACPHETKH